MLKVNAVQPSAVGYGFVVTNEGNRPAANLDFKNKADADAAHQKMEAILEKCQKVSIM